MTYTIRPRCQRCGVEAMWDDECSQWVCRNDYCRDKGKYVNQANLCPKCKADWGEVFECLASLPMTPDRVIGEAIVAGCQLCYSYFHEMPMRIALEAERHRRQMAAIKKALG